MSAPEPAQCVCNCEGPPPEGAIVKIKEQPAEEKKAAAPTLQQPLHQPRQLHLRPLPLRRGRSSAKSHEKPEEGSLLSLSGVPKVMSDADKANERCLFAIAKASKSRNLGEMQKTTTERLGKSLEASLRNMQSTYRQPTSSARERSLA